MDTREQTTPFYRKLKLDCKSQVLPFDYLAVGAHRTVSIERKSIEDFLNGVYSGRLFVQAQRVGELEVSHSHCYLVYGSLFEATRIRHANPYMIMSVTASILEGFGYSVLFLPSEPYALMFLRALDSKSEAKTYVPTVKPQKGVDSKNYAYSLLASIPHVGPKTLEKFKGRKLIDVLVELSKGDGSGVLAKSYALEASEVLNTVL
ncbi:MAG: hypothetical protein QXO47_10425 [Thermoproteota archaeon]